MVRASWQHFKIHITKRVCRLIWLYGRPHRRDGAPPHSHARHYGIIGLLVCSHGQMVAQECSSKSSSLPWLTQTKVSTFHIPVRPIGDVPHAPRRRNAPPRFVSGLQITATETVQKPLVICVTYDVQQISSPCTSHVWGSRVLHSLPGFSITPEREYKGIRMRCATGLRGYFP
jgi:hypothetical protein